MQDVLTLCENCEKKPSISVTTDDVDLCAECELTLIDEMAFHEDDCACVICEADAPQPGNHELDCGFCTCGVAGRVGRRKAWLREQIAKAAA